MTIQEEYEIYCQAKRDIDEEPLPLEDFIELNKVCGD